MIRNIFLLLFLCAGLSKSTRAQTASDSLDLATELMARSELQKALPILRAIHPTIHQLAAFDDETRVRHLILYTDCLKRTDTRLSKNLLDQAEGIILASSTMNEDAKTTFEITIARFTSFYLRHTEDYIRRFEALVKKASNQFLDPLLRVEVLSLYGGMYMHDRAFDVHRILDTLSKAGQWVDEYNIQDSPLIARVFGSLADVQIDLGFNYAAMESCDRVLLSFPDSMSNMLAFTAGLQAFTAAELAEEMYDLDKATTILGKFEHRLSNQTKPNLPMIRMLKSKLASILGQQGKYDAAIRLMDQLTHDLEIRNQDHAMIIHLQNHVDLLLGAKRFEQAVLVAGQALQLFQQQIMQQDEYAAHDHLTKTQRALKTSLGLAHFGLEHYTEAKNCFLENSDTSELMPGEELRLTLYLALCAAHSHDWTDVFARLEVIQQLFTTYTELGENMFQCQVLYLDLLADIFNQEGTEVFRKMIVDQIQSFNMPKIAEVILHDAYPSTPVVASIMNYCEFVLELHQRHNVLADHQIYQTIENLRGIKLWSKNVENKYWQARLNHTKLLDERQQLKSTIHAVVAALYENPLREEYEVLHYTKDSLLNLLDKFDQTNHKPDLLNVAIIPNNESLSKLQHVLRVDELLVEYFYGSNHVYIMTISTDSLMLSAAPVSQVDRLSQIVRSDLSQSKQLHATSHKDLFELLLQNSLPPINNTNSILIVPDGPLHHLPFEALTTYENKYLIEDVRISYHESGQFHLYQKQRPIKKKSSYNLYACAPTYNAPTSKNVSLDTRTLVSAIGSADLSLPGAAEEAKRICSIWDGTLEKQKHISADHFFQQVRQSDIVHLGMHAVVNTENYYESYLMLGREQEDQLDFGQITAQSLDLDLISLSACNTGLGDTRPGNGSNSLARGFLMAGIDAVLMSLWQVPDETTANIMVSFYSNLKAGFPKDLALQQAKVDYLNNVDDPALKHPYFWSGFVLVGSVDPLVGVSTWPLAYILFFGALVLLAACAVFLFKNLVISRGL